MIKMEISFDEEQINSKGLSLQDVKDKTDCVFKTLQLRKKTDGTNSLWYEGIGSPHDFANFGNAISFLKDKDWFFPHLTKWIWYNSDGLADETDFRCEDILLFYTNKQKQNKLKQE